MSGCCWQFQCDGSGNPVQVRSIPGLTAGQCPTTATQLFVPGACAPSVPSSVCGGGSHHHGGCCWQYLCQADGCLTNVRGITGLLPSQCPASSKQLYVPDSACVSTPPARVCPGPCKPPAPAPTPGPAPGPPPAPYDGVALMVSLTKAVRKAMPSPFLLSHAPQTPYLTLDPAMVPGLNINSPGYYGSYLAIMAQVGPLIDFLNIQAYNNCPLQECPVGAWVLNNLIASSPVPSVLPPIYGGLPIKPLKASQVLFGQQIPPKATCGPKPPVPPAGVTPVSPLTLPWCSGLGNVNHNIGLMFWLNNPGSDIAANAVVDTWYPPTGLSPPNRVVYYLNGPTTYNIPTSGYSRCNTIILGFIYPALNMGGANPCPLYNGMQPWACFGFYYAFAAAGKPLLIDPPSYAQQLASWRAVEPTKRKIMVGLGGADSTPIYSTWAQPGAVDVVAKGLAQFFKAFEAYNGFALDGLDIDYEDSNALATHPPVAVKRNMFGGMTVLPPLAH